MRSTAISLFFDWRHKIKHSMRIGRFYWTKWLKTTFYRCNQPSKEAAGLPRGAQAMKWTQNMLHVRGVHKRRPHKIAKNRPLFLVRKMCPHWLNPPPALSVKHIINYKKSKVFCTKMRTSASEFPPRSQNVRTR